MKFPIIGTNESIPLEVIIQHEPQALKNHGQTIKRLSERGGLSWCEALAVLKDREWKHVDKEQAKTAVLKAVSDFYEFDRKSVVENYYRASTALMEIGTTKNLPCDLKEICINASRATIQIIDYINNH